MNHSNGWWCVEWLARFANRRDRETLLGDLLEAGESSGRACLSVAGLLVRRQLWLWRDWRPWVAAFVLAIPASFLLMGFSVGVALRYQSAIDGTVLQATGWKPGPGVTMILCDIALLAAWSWTGGLAVGTISRRTTWISFAFSLLPCLFCLARFRIDCLSRLSLLLFLPPALAGLWLGFRAVQIRFRASLAVAVVITVLTVPHWGERGAWLPNWALSWPAWYLVLIAARRNTQLRGELDGE